MTDVLDQYLPGDIEDEGGAPLTDQVAEHSLLALMVAHPEISTEMRALVSGREFFDRSLGRVFDGICEMGGFEPTASDMVKWVGDEKVEIAGRPVRQFFGYLRGLGVDLAKDDASGLADHIFECAERRFTSEGQTNLVGADAFQSKMGLLTWADRNISVPDLYDWLIEDTVPERELTIIMGATQAGKSFLAFHMAMCLARGIPFFGREILKPVPVIWCAFEGGRGARARMLAYASHHNVDGEFPFAALTQPIDLWSKDLNVEELIKEIEGVIRTEFAGVRPGAVYIDTHNAATPGASEIDSEAVSKIRDRYRRIIEAIRCAVIIIGHTNALGKHRGNELLVNNVDTVMTVTKKTVIKNRLPEQIKDDDRRDVRSLELIKQREGETGHLFDFVLPAVETGIKNKFGKIRTSCVVVAPNWSEQAAAEANTVAKKSDTKAGFKLTDHEDHFFSVLWKALEQRGATAPAELGLASNVRVVHRAEVSKLYKASFIPSDGSQAAPDNTIKSRWDRANNKLRRFKVIGYQNDLFWWTGKPILGKPETFQQQMLFDERDLPPDDEFPPDQ